MSLTPDHTMEDNSSEALIRSLVRIPREIRDLIYPLVVAEDDPISLKEIKAQPFDNEILSNPMFLDEALEAYYRINTFILVMTHLPIAGDKHDKSFGPHQDIAKRHIRHLIVPVNEAEPFQWSNSSTARVEEVYRSCFSRIKWYALFKFPQLRSLTVEMQKTTYESLWWKDFGPILCDLQTRKPRLSIRFLISFDDLFLRRLAIATFLKDHMDGPYKPMGFIDITYYFVTRDWAHEGRAVFGQASEDDKKHVDRYIPDKIMPPPMEFDPRFPATHVGRFDRDITQFGPNENRITMEGYVTKEPQLFRVLMEEQFKEYELRGKVLE